MAQLLVAPDTPVDPEVPGFIMSDWIELAPFEELLGLQLEKCANGTAILSMSFLVKYAQGGGLLHGGALTTLADTAVAMAIKSVLPPGTRFATTQLSTRFLAPVCSGRVTATATIQGPQGRTFLGEATVTDAAGCNVAHFTATFRVARGQGYDD